jgi:putative mRNA 3-end processing factor
MKIVMHGAGQEVGRSCIEVQWHNRRIILDCGLKIGPDANEYPTPIKKPQEIDALFLSHAHMDHSGALPLFHNEGLTCPIFCNDVTREITHLMLKDSWKIDRIEGRDIIYAKSCIRDVIRRMRPSAQGAFKGIKYRFIPSGHIPGSMMIHLTYKGESLLYTGDMNGLTTRLVKGYRTPPKSDVVITEATYGNRTHPARSTVEKQFKNILNETMDRGGSLLVAVFAISRAQEVMLLLDELRPPCPVYLDGMSKAVTKIFLRHMNDLKNRDLAHATKRVDMVTSWERRKKITQRQGVFLATSGMLDGGPILAYLKALGRDPKNTLVLSGYQAEETNGRRLLEHGYVFLDGKPFDITCPVYHLDFSAHGDEGMIHDIIDKADPAIVIANHGEAGSAKSIAAYAKAHGRRGYYPKTGETLDLGEVRYGKQ